MSISHAVRAAFAVGVDLVSLVLFGLMLSHGPVTGLIHPPLNIWWMTLVLAAHLAFFAILWTLFKQETSVVRFVQKFNAVFDRPGPWYVGILKFLLWLALIILGLLQALVEMVYVFLNFITTSNSISILPQTLTVVLIVASSLAFALIASLPIRRHSQRNPELVQRLLTQYPWFVTSAFALASIFFPVLSLIITIRLLNRSGFAASTPLAPTTHNTFFGLAQSLLGLMVLNLLQVEVVIQTTSSPHAFSFYLQRLLMIFILWYLPYKLLLWLSQEKRQTWELVWPPLYLGIQLILIYVFA